VGDGKAVAVTTTVSGGEVTVTVTTSGVQATSNKASAAKMGKG
jgi:predicted MarR family transcription regulator